MTATSNQSASFVVSEFKHAHKKTLRAIFTLDLPSGLRLIGCTLHEKDGARWISLPAQSYTTDDGVKKWKPLIEFTNKVARDRFQAAAKEAIDDYRKRLGT
jgi:hypothetical protein